MSKAGERILRSVRTARELARGQTAEGFVVHTPESIASKASQEKFGLSQGLLPNVLGCTQQRPASGSEGEGCLRLGVDV